MSQKTVTKKNEKQKEKKETRSCKLAYPTPGNLHHFCRDRSPQSAHFCRVLVVCCVVWSMLKKPSAVCDRGEQ